MHLIHPFQIEKYHYFKISVSPDGKTYTQIADVNAANYKDYYLKDYVCTVIDLAKKTWNEAHRFMGFVRFTELAGGILYADIKPENDVLPLIAPHFANRYPEENWVIYDERRDRFAIHRAGKGWMVLEDMKIAEEVRSQLSMEEDDYRAMWKAFTKSIAIEARKNEQLQKQLLPLKFRDKMSEFIE